MNNLYNKGRFRYGEWAKHLRPYLKAKGNRRWRKFSENQIADFLEEEDQHPQKSPRLGRKRKRFVVEIVYHDDHLPHRQRKRYASMRDVLNAAKRPEVKDFVILEIHGEKIR